MVFVQNGMTKNLGRNYVFSIVKFLDENCDEKLHPQSEEKIPKWLLTGTNPTYNEKGKNKKNISFVCKAVITLENNRYADTH